MKILAFFTSSGTPATGLSPTIRIYDLSDDSLVVNDDSMSEVGDGHYKYDFATYDADKDYAIRCDGGISLSDSDRYKYAGNENYIDDIENSSLADSNTYILGVSGDIINLQTDITNIQSDITTINTNVLSVSASVLENQDYLKRIIGLVHENIYIDNPVYDGDGNLTSARLRIYSAPGSVGTVNDVIGTYQITAPGDGAGRFTSWKQIKV
jgi:hypothetical protein